MNRRELLTILPAVAILPISKWVPQPVEIHPFDLFCMIMSRPVESVIVRHGPKHGDPSIVSLDGVVYHETGEVPPRTAEGKRLQESTMNINRIGIMYKEVDVWWSGELKNPRVSYEDR